MLLLDSYGGAPLEGTPHGVGWGGWVLGGLRLGRGVGVLGGLAPIGGLGAWGLGGLGGLDRTGPMRPSNNMPQEIL